MHGGAAPQNLAAGERRVAEQQLAKTVKSLGLRRDISPEDALLEEIQWAAGHVQWLRGRVQQLEPDALVWGVTEEKDVGSGERPGLDITQSAQPSIWWVLYERERTHLLRLIHEAGVQKIEDRRVRIAESQGLLIAQVMRESLTELARLLAAGEIGTVDPSEPAVMRVVSSRLRLLAGGEAS